MAKQRETKQALPTLPAAKTQRAAKTVQTAKALEKSAQEIENMETMLDEKRKKRMNIRKRRQHKKKCEEARAVLYAHGQHALFQIARDKKKKNKNKDKSKLSQTEAKTTPTKPAETKSATTEPSLSKPSPLDQSRLKTLLSDQPSPGKKHVGSASPIAIKVERGKETISFTQDELDTVLSPVQQSMITANECRDQLDRFPHPHPAGERYWKCMLDSDPWGLQPGEAESVLTRLRHSLLELMNQRAVDK